MFVPKFPPPTAGGLEKQALELAMALRDQKVTVSALSFRFVPGMPPTQTVDGVLVRRVGWSNSRIRRMAGLPILIFSALLINRKSFDIIHLHQHSWIGLYVILCAKLLGKPILTKLPNVGELGIPGLRREFLGWLKVKILLHSDGIVAMTKDSILELTEFGYPDKSVFVTPNGISVSATSLSGVGHKADSGAVCRVVFVGRLEAQKQLHVLLKAWQGLIAECGPLAQLEIWGDGTLSQDLQQFCSSLGIDASVHFRGHVEDVRTKLPNMDIFVLTSSVEGNSNAVLEAMDAGLPIVATRTGGTPMQVGRDGAELLFDVCDCDGLKDSLASLIQDANRRTAFGSAMRKRVEANFDIKVVAASYVDAYRALTAVPKQPLNSERFGRGRRAVAFDAALSEFAGEP
jgi:glycosyltransferase involved in cell wall biosynthesis